MTAIVIKPCEICGVQPVYNVNEQGNNVAHSLKCEKGHCICGGLKYDELVICWNECQVKAKNKKDAELIAESIK